MLALFGTNLFLQCPLSQIQTPRAGSSLCHLNFEGILDYLTRNGKKLQVLLPFCVPALEYGGGLIPKRAKHRISWIWFAVVSCAASQWELHDPGSLHVPRIQPGPGAGGPGQVSASEHQLCSHSATSSCLFKVWIQQILLLGGNFATLHALVVFTFSDTSFWEENTNFTELGSSESIILDKIDPARGGFPGSF